MKAHEIGVTGTNGARKEVGLGVKGKKQQKWRARVASAAQHAHGLFLFFSLYPFLAVNR